MEVSGWVLAIKADHYHADLRRHQVAEPVEPLHISLHVTCFFVITKATLQESKFQKGQYHHSITTRLQFGQELHLGHCFPVNFLNLY